MGPVMEGSWRREEPAAGGRAAAGFFSQGAASRGSWRDMSEPSPRDGAGGSGPRGRWGHGMPHENFDRGASLDTGRWSALTDRPPSRGPPGLHGRAGWQQEAAPPTPGAYKQGPGRMPSWGAAPPPTESPKKGADLKGKWSALAGGPLDSLDSRQPHWGAGRGRTAAPQATPGAGRGAPTRADPAPAPGAPAPAPSPAPGPAADPPGGPRGPNGRGFQMGRGRALPRQGSSVSGEADRVPRWSSALLPSAPPRASAAVPLGQGPSRHKYPEVEALAMYANMTSGGRVALPRPRGPGVDPAHPAWIPEGTPRDPSSDTAMMLYLDELAPEEGLARRMAMRQESRGDGEGMGAGEGDAMGELGWEAGVGQGRGRGASESGGGAGRRGDSEDGGRQAGAERKSGWVVLGRKGAREEGGAAPGAGPARGEGQGPMPTASSEARGEGANAFERTAPTPAFPIPHGASHPPLPEAAFITQWIYQDPQGQLQGPFTREDILEWYEQGFFPDNLPMRPAEAPVSAPFVPVVFVLPMWVAAMVATGSTHPQMPRWAQMFRVPLPGMAGPFAESPHMSGGMPERMHAGRPGPMGGSLPEPGMLPNPFTMGLGHPMPGPAMGMLDPGQPRAPAPTAEGPPQGQEPQGDQVSPSLGQKLLGTLMASMSLRGEGAGAGGGASEPAAARGDAAAGSSPGAQQRRARGNPLAGAVKAMTLQEVEGRMRGENKQPEGGAPAPAMGGGGAGGGGGGPGWAVVGGPRGGMLAPGDARGDAGQPGGARAHGDEAGGGSREVGGVQESRPAPWAQHSAGPRPGLSLAEIQRQEQEEAMRREMERAAAMQARQAQMGAMGWGGGGMVGPSGHWSQGPPKSLRDIQAEEEASRMTAMAGQPGGGDARGAESGIWGAGPWGPTPAPAPAGSLADMLRRQAQGQDAQQRKAQEQAAQQQQQQGGMFGRQSTPVSGGWPAAPPQAQPQGPAPGGPAQPQPQPRQAPSQPAAPQHDAQGGRAADPDVPVDGSGRQLSPDFRDWCRSQLLDLTGSTDLALIEFLMTLASRSEVAEYVQLYLGTSERVAAFTTEFLDRMFAEKQGIRYNPGRRGGSSGAGGTGGGAGGQGSQGRGSQGAGDGDRGGEGWEKIPRVGQGPGKKKAGRGGKGGAEGGSGTSFDALLRGGVR